MNTDQTDILYLRLWGYGIPCVMIVLSRATTGRCSARASNTVGWILNSTSGENTQPITQHWCCFCYNERFEAYSKVKLDVFGDTDEQQIEGINHFKWFSKVLGYS